ncbi:MAG: TylF/MycF/NovP-related O-methyltransferase [Limisphaerales bacterium]
MAHLFKKAFGLLFRDPKTLRWHLRIRLLRGCCALFSRSGFYLQGKMDLDPKCWWHNPDFLAASGGWIIPGDPVKRAVLALEPWDTVRRDMIILLLRSLVERAVEGDLAELGVFRGNTARLIHHYLPERKLYLFDTFAGFDERDVRIEGAQTGRKTRTAEFSETNVEMARKYIAPQNDNVQFFPGYFPESAPEFLRQRKFALAHLDADLYEPMLAGLNYFYDKVVPGGIILAHDFNSWPGARKAVQDFFRDKPEIPLPMPDKSGSALIIKQGVIGQAGATPMGR